MQAVTRSFSKDKNMFRCKTRPFCKWVAFMKKEAHARIRRANNKACQEYILGNLDFEVEQPMPVSGHDVC